MKNGQDQGLSKKLTCPTGKSARRSRFSRSSLIFGFSENIRFAVSPNQIYIHHVPALRGAYHDRHGRWAWDAVDAAASGVKRIAGRASGL
jgi:hypothetical protein